MTKKILITIALIISGFVAMAQKGQVWPTQTRQDFDINSDGEITKQYDVQDYNSYYLFINNNEFIHCTNDITSLYKIIKRTENKDYIDYTVVSEVGNTYYMRFAQNEKYIVITNLEKGYSIYEACYTPYTTQVFSNINK